jgi:hypothetical protein
MTVRWLIKQLEACDPEAIVQWRDKDKVFPARRGDLIEAPPTVILEAIILYRPKQHEQT